jgi:hypothetical protein
MSTWDARSVVPMTLVSETGQEGNSANAAIQPDTAPRALIWRTQDADPLRSRFRPDVFWRYLPPKHSPVSAPPPYDQRTEESTARTISSLTEAQRPENPSKTIVPINPARTNPLQSPQSRPPKNSPSHRLSTPHSHPRWSYSPRSTSSARQQQRRHPRAVHGSRQLAGPAERETRRRSSGCRLGWRCP